MDARQEEGQAGDGASTAMQQLAAILALGQETRLDEALAGLDALIAAAPGFALARLERANVLARLERYEEGLDACRPFLSGPARPQIVVDLNEAIHDLAIARLEQQSLSPGGDVRTLCRRARIHALAGHEEQAGAIWLRVLELEPENAEALNELGSLLLAAGRHEEALAVYRRILARQAGLAPVWVNCGNVLRQLGRHDEAFAAYRRALELQPELAEAQMEMAQALLLQEDFAEGWARLEWRWRTAQLAGRYLSSPAPAWQGESLAGRHILLWTEQGAGDAIQFARYLPLVADLAASVTLRAPPALAELLATADPRVNILPVGEVLPAHDCHCPLLSLPLRLSRPLPAVAASPYLQADARRRQAWKAYLAPLRQPRVGLVWAGRRGDRAGDDRHLALVELLPLAGLASLVCLQKEFSGSDPEVLAAWPEMRVPGELLRDFAETAALIAELDLVVSVDTAVAHLAGALGKPCCLLLRHGSEWRWGAAGESSLWYASLRLFRQAAPGAWAEPVAAIAALLAQLQGD